MDLRDRAPRLLMISEKLCTAQGKKVEKESRKRKIGKRDREKHRKKDRKKDREENFLNSVKQER